MQGKKLSLLIPKHQNKTSKEITQMYLTQSSKKSGPAVDQDYPSKPEKLAKGKTQSQPLPTDQKTESRPSTKASPLLNPFIRQEPSSKEESPFELLSQILHHREKTSELQESNQEKEQEMLKAFISCRQAVQRPLKKLRQSEIIEEFKTEAMNMDKKISSLAEENKNLKEKLALAMIEEVDEKIRREKPCDRLIEAWSCKPSDKDPDPPLSDLFSSVSGLSPWKDSEVFSLKLDSFFSLASEDQSVPLIHLCQLISNDRKRFKKQELENSRLLRLKREVVFRLSRSIEAQES